MPLPDGPRPRDRQGFEDSSDELDPQLIIPIGVLMFISNYIAFIEPLFLGEVKFN